MFLVFAIWPSAHLIIAMPQSSSTSFMEELGTITRLPFRQTIDCDRRNISLWNASFSGIHMHSDTCTQPKDVLNAWVTSGDSINKQHIVPDPSNMHAVRQLCECGARIVLLTRSVNSSVHAACERDVIEKNRVDLLEKYHAIRRWYDGWLAFSQTVDSCLLHVRFEELRSCPQRVVTGVAKFLNITVHSPLPNVKRRYVHKTSRQCRMFGTGDMQNYRSHRAIC